MTETDESPKTSRWSWLLWWQIDQAKLEKQVTQYDTLEIRESMRGISVLCIAAIVALDVCFIAFGQTGSTYAADLYAPPVAMTVLAVFIYLGHRWAMLGAMIVWTAGKFFSVAMGVGNTHGQGQLVLQIVWWCIFMHPFYFAFRVEQDRRALAAWVK